jgi:DNA repair protein RecO (recombination protein O)
VNYRDNDRVLTLVSRGNGRMTVTSRGCRNPKSKLLSCSQPFCYGEYEIFDRNGHEYISGCDVREIFYELRLNVNALSAAFYACSVCETVAVPGETFERGFSLLLHTLKSLCEDGCDIDGALTFFLLKLMGFLGLSPQADACIQCGADGRLFAFDTQQCGVVCERCKPTSRHAFSITPAMKDAIRDLPNLPSAAYASVSEALKPIAPRLLPLIEAAFSQLIGQPLPKRSFVHWQSQLQ